MAAGVATGVGGWIVAAADPADVWGVVVAEEAECWRLKSGRVAKKQTEGSRWRWGPPAAPPKSDSPAELPPTELNFTEQLYPDEEVASGQRRLVMLIGLPASGKTFWARHYVRSHPHARFLLLSTQLLMERMADGEKTSYDDRFPALVQEATRTLEKHIDAAAAGEDNVIWDQTNCYPGRRREKLARFAGFHKTAVVFVPPQGAHTRWRQRQRDAGQNTPAEVYAEMQRGFVLPAEGEFDRVVYAFRNSAEDLQQALKRYREEADDTFSAAKRGAGAAGAPAAKAPRVSLSPQQAQRSPPKAKPSSSPRDSAGSFR